MFWFILILFTLAIGVIAFYPVLRGASQTHAKQRDKLNKAFYFDRLKEVENEVAEGVLDDADSARLELQQSLLNDIPAEANTASLPPSGVNKIWFFGLILLMAALSFGSYFYVGDWKTEIDLRKAHEQLPALYQRIDTQQDKPLSGDELTQLIMGLRMELQANPKDAKSWYMLGQVAMNANNAQLAMDSLSKAYELAPNELAFKVAYAQILLFSNDEMDTQLGDKLLREVIREDHSNPDALGLLAIRSFEQGDYKMAAMTWAMLIKQLPSDDPRIETYERSIELAKEKLSPEERAALALE